MSNWIAAEFTKFNSWVQAHVESSNSKLGALEERVAILEREVGINAPPPPPAP